MRWPRRQTHSSAMWSRLSSAASHVDALHQCLLASEARPEGRHAVIQLLGSIGVETRLPCVMATTCAAWTACVMGCNRALSCVRSVDRISTRTARASCAVQSTLASDRRVPQQPLSVRLDSVACHRAVLTGLQDVLTQLTTPLQCVLRRGRLRTGTALLECIVVRIDRQTGARARPGRAA